MKFLAVLSLSMFLSLSVQAQWSYSINAGAAPGKEINSQAVSLPALYEGSDYALTPTSQSANYAIGVSAKKALKSGFFFQTELIYNTETTEYNLEEIGNNGVEITPATNFHVREHRISIPASMGAELGNFSAHTGVSINGIVSSDDELDNLPGIDDDSKSLYLGWHAGLKYTMGHFGLEVRYVQDFRNHGSGLTYGTKEVQFYGNRNRIMILGSYNF